VNPLSFLLDLMFGPRVFVVIQDEDGDICACHDSRVLGSDLILRDRLRWGRAGRVARRLRLKAEDTPRPLF
jgi:hypothetical protein